MRFIGAKERCCCGCSVILGAQILATISGVWAACSCFTAFFSGWNWLYMLAQVLYLFASVCASGLVFQAIRTRRSILMAPQMLVAIINTVALVIFFVTCMLTGFGVYTYINANVQYMYEHYTWFYNMFLDKQGQPLKEPDLTNALQSYAEASGWSGAFGSFLVTIFAVWVFIVYFDCFRTIKAGEGYPTAQYHGNDNITVPIYPTYPAAPSYYAAASAAAANPAPAYSGPGSTYDIPPSYNNAAMTTADETPVKVPLP